MKERKFMFEEIHTPIIEENENNDSMTENEENNVEKSKTSLLNILIPKEKQVELRKISMDIIMTKKPSSNHLIIYNITKKDYILLFISSILFSISICFPKFLKIPSNNNYSAFTYLFFHSLTVLISVYIYYIKFKKENLLNTLKTLKHKKWFILRINLNFFGVLFFVLSLGGIRNITSCLFIIVSIPTFCLFGYFLIEKQKTQRLFFGIFAFITSTGILFFEEIPLLIKNNLTKSKIYIFIIYLIISCSCFSLINILNEKKLSLNEYDLFIQMFLNHLIMILYSFICLILYKVIGYNIYFTKINYILISILSGIIFTFAFIISHDILLKMNTNNTTNLQEYNNNRLKLLLIYNFKIIFIIPLSALISKEIAFFMDFISATIIILYKIFFSVINFNDNSNLFY